MISLSGLIVLFALLNNNNGDIGHSCLDTDFNKALVFIAVHGLPQTWWLKTTHIYYLTSFHASVRAWLSLRPAQDVTRSWPDCVRF